MLVNSNIKISDAEKEAYIKYAEEKYPDRTILSINLKFDGEFVDIVYNFAPSPKFQRIRRITGYLTGTVDRWNNAKSSELKDRVKHIKIKKEC